jgi:arsenate reductase
MKKVLIVCTGNSCRSQMAEGYLRFFVDNDAEIYSAGIETHGVNPRAIAAMKEDNMDISNHTSNSVNEYINIHFDVVITLCDNAKDRCPYISPNAKRYHQAFPDPYNFVGSEQETAEEFRRVRDLIKAYFKRFSAEFL